MNSYFAESCGFRTKMDLIAFGKVFSAEFVQY